VISDAFEDAIIKRMKNQGVTFTEAMEYEFIEQGVPNNVYDRTEFLELVCDQDMGRVWYYMGMLSGEFPDQVLVKNKD
tara:strand:- start:550 stop:783 length:234 start_codon:yes stop_codon:yes gene_type:complete